MDKADDIAAMVGDTVAGLGLQLWGVEYAPRPRNSLVRLYIDHAEREVTIDDCEAVSREVAALFDVNDPVRGAYTLEVSSPGLDRSFFAAGQLPRFLGESLEVSLHAPVAGRRRVQGTLAAVDGEAVRLDTAEGAFEFEFAQASRVRLKPDYARLLGSSGSGRPGAGSAGDRQ